MLIENIQTRFQKQKITHDPDSGHYGDCFRTAIATLLDVPADAVPHFCADGRFTIWDVNEWLAENHGVVLMGFAYSGERMGLDDVLRHIKTTWGNDVVYLLSGESKNGCNHVVICQGGLIVHDPSLDDSGIVGPCDNGHYAVEFLCGDPRDSSLRKQG